MTQLRKIFMCLTDEIAKIGRRLFCESRPNLLDVAKIYGDLGIEKGYSVCSSSYLRLARQAADLEVLKKVDGEWLYDLCWYSAGRTPFDGLPLVLECELNTNLKSFQNGIVDGDFGKLVQARADVRVWVSQVNTTALAYSHIEACMASAEAFSGSQKGDQYVFLLYDWQNTQTLAEVRSLGK